MDRGSIPPLRSLPRVFVPGASAEEPIDLPKEEVEKFRKVLRLEEGDQIAVLPNDGSLLRCEFRHRQAVPLSVEWPNTEAPVKLTLIQALPKGDRLDAVIRACTEIGVAKFVLFQAERSVVRWDEGKRADRLRRYQAIAREAAEQSYRCVIPELAYVADLAAALREYPGCIVLSEVEHLEAILKPTGVDTAIAIGPEGGWAPRELSLIGDRGVTMGPRVLRTDTAGPAAAAVMLLSGDK